MTWLVVRASAGVSDLGRGDEVLGVGCSPRSSRPLFVRLSLAFGVIGALVVLLSVASPPLANADTCENMDSLKVPGAEKQDNYCLADLTTKSLIAEGRTNVDDWEGLNSAASTNPPGAVPGIQIDGYFPDDSNTNNNNG